MAQTPLHRILSEAHIKRAYFCGLAYDVCVAYSAQDAVDLGYETFFVEDASRGVTEEGMASMKHKLTQAGVSFIHSSELLRGSAPSSSATGPCPNQHN